MTGSLQGLSICRGGPQISHLFFADDSLIFCRATIADCRALTYLLSCYERVSGQKLNQEKTSLFFSTNTHHERLKMLLWRIGSEILPTNAALVARMGKGDPLCPLCHVENETLPHLFFYCQVSRLFWFGVCWGFKSEAVHVGNGLDIIKFVLNRLVCHGSPTELCGISPDSSTQLALILDCIWSFRNQIVHQGPLQSPLTYLKSLELRIMEHSASLDPGDFMRPREVSR